MNEIDCIKGLGALARQKAAANPSSEQIDDVTDWVLHDIRTRRNPAPSYERRAWQFAAGTGLVAAVAAMGFALQVGAWLDNPLADMGLHASPAIHNPLDLQRSSFNLELP